MSEESAKPSAAGPEVPEPENDAVARLAAELKKRLLGEALKEAGDAVLDRLLLERAQRRPVAQAADALNLLRGGPSSETEASPQDFARALRAVLAQKEAEAKDGRAHLQEGGAKPSIWANVIPALITGVTFATMALGIFVSLNSSMSEIQKTNRELATQLATATANTANLTEQFKDWRSQNEKKSEQSDVRLRGIEASLARIEARLEPGGRRP